MLASAEAKKMNQTAKKYISELKKAYSENQAGVSWDHFEMIKHGLSRLITYFPETSLNVVKRAFCNNSSIFLSFSVSNFLFTYTFDPEGNLTMAVVPLGTITFICRILLTPEWIINITLFPASIHCCPVRITKNGIFFKSFREVRVCDV